MLRIKHRGNFNKTERFLTNATKANRLRILDKYGREGVAALASATPVDSGLTASSWGYEINITGRSFSITWTNTNMESGVPVAILLQYGHGTRNGGYVEGKDYINPAIQPIFKKIADEIWKEVTSL